MHKCELSSLYFRTTALKAKFVSMDLTPSELTPAMEEVIARRAERLASGRAEFILSRILLGTLILN